jgi:hypothetical protein
LISKRNENSKAGRWAEIADEELLNTALDTDSPQGLDNLVTSLPDGDEEPFVEYSYDLRRSGQESLHCVHDNHPHLAGFVMNKGGKRFLVGHICGAKIYGTSFERYHADFDAAVQRKDALRRAKEIKQATEPFSAYLNEIESSGIFDRFEKVLDQFNEHMPWVYDQLFYIAHADPRAERVGIPTDIFSEENDPRLEWQKAASEFNSLALKAIGLENWAENNLASMKRMIEAFLKRFELVIDRLAEVEALFQPEVLALICEYANAYDNPKKRKYIPGLLALTCKKERDEVTLKLPKNYVLPSKKRIDEFRSTLAGFKLEAEKAA